MAVPENEQSKRLIGEDEIAQMRRILFDTPLQTDDDYAKIAELVDEESAEG